MTCNEQTKLQDLQHLQDIERALNYIIDTSYIELSYDISSELEIENLLIDVENIRRTLQTELGRWCDVIYYNLYRKFFPCTN